MGYTTDFEGRFNLNKPLSPEDKLFLTKFSETRRMARKLGPEFGVEGEFYVDGGGSYGQDRDGTIIDYNRPPATQPGLWCQWVPTGDDTGLEWNGAEKFYEYTAWLVYIVKNFLAPKGYILNGDVTWQGEDSSDFGVLSVRNNVVKEILGKQELPDVVAAWATPKKKTKAKTFSEKLDTALPQAIADAADVVLILRAALEGELEAEHRVTAARLEAQVSGALLLLNAAVDDLSSLK